MPQVRGWTIHLQNIQIGWFLKDKNDKKKHTHIIWHHQNDHNLTLYILKGHHASARKVLKS